jgi:hypothetical protein
MNIAELLDKLPLWGVFLTSLIIIFLSIRFGFQIGKWKRARLTGDEKLHIGPIVTASLSLLAFMLAMVFNVVESRYVELKHVALDEANAIGTAYIQADLLPEADRAKIRQLLYDYVTLRVEAGRNGTRELTEQAIDRAKVLQSDLWSKAAAVATQQPTPISALFLQSLNQLIDLHEKRITIGIHYRLPAFIWAVLYCLAILAMGMAGYDSGLTGSHRMIGITLSAALAFSVVLVLVVALDRPWQHLSTDRQAPMIDVEEDIRRSMQSKP